MPLLIGAPVINIQTPAPGTSAVAWEDTGGPNPKIIKYPLVLWVVAEAPDGQGSNIAGVCVSGPRGASIILADYLPNFVGYAAPTTGAPAAQVDVASDLPPELLAAAQEAMDAARRAAAETPPPA